jgi:hypothetical protein
MPPGLSFRFQNLKNEIKQSPQIFVRAVVDQTLTIGLVRQLGVAVP